MFSPALQWQYLKWRKKTPLTHYTAFSWKDVYRCGKNTTHKRDERSEKLVETRDTELRCGWKNPMEIFAPEKKKRNEAKGGKCKQTNKTHITFVNDAHTARLNSTDPQTLQHQNAESANDSDSPSYHLTPLPSRNETFRNIVFVVRKNKPFLIKWFVLRIQRVL